MLTKCEKITSATTRQERTKYLTNYWKGLMGDSAVVYSHDGTKNSAWVVAGLEGGS